MGLHNVRSIENTRGSQFLNLAGKERLFITVSGALAQTTPLKRRLNPGQHSCAVGVHQNSSISIVDKNRRDPVHKVMNKLVYTRNDFKGD